MTICHQWAWKPDDAMKSLKQCLQTLVRCAGGDGNLLFNVGPMPTGEIEPRQVERLKEMGAVAGQVRRDDLRHARRAVQAQPADRQHAQGQHGLRPRPQLGRRLRHAARRCRRRSSPLGAHRRHGRRSSRPTTGSRSRVAAANRQEIDTIVKLELDGPALDIRPVSLPTSIKATASNVYQHMDDYAPEMAFDDDPGTRWATDGGTKQAWIAIDLGKPVTVEGVTIEEDFPGRVEKFELQYKDGGEWKTFLSGTKLGHFSQKFPPVTARHVRLNILQANEGPTISEIRWIEKPKK